MHLPAVEEERLCPVCGEGALRPEVSSQTVEYKGFEKEIPVYFAVCGTCGSEVSEQAESRANKREMIAFRKEVEGLLPGREIAAFRETFGLTQGKAAKLFGGGQVAFSRYENDDVAQSEPMDRLIRLCMEKPENLVNLAEKSGVSLPAAAIQASQPSGSLVAVRSSMRTVSVEAGSVWVFASKVMRALDQQLPSEHRDRAGSRKGKNKDIAPWDGVAV